MEDLSSFSRATIFVLARFLSALRYSSSRACGEDEGILGCFLVLVRLGGEVGDSKGERTAVGETTGDGAIAKGMGMEFRDEGKRQ